MSDITGDHRRALYAFLKRDDDEFDRISYRIDPHDSDSRFGVLFGAAFVEAVHRRFSGTFSPAEVIRFVASVRARSNISGDLDPVVCERVIGVALGGQLARKGLTKEEKIAQFPLLQELVADIGLDGAELDSFISKAARLAAIHA